MALVFISVGSNIERERHIRAAVDALSALGEIELSPVYETEAIGFEGEAFYNLVVALHTALPLEALASRLREIEAGNGRQRGGPKFSARTLDLDILTYDDLSGTIAGVQLPRDEITRYAFVLKPLADIAPDARHPALSGSYAELWEAMRASAPALKVVPLALG